MRGIRKLMNKDNKALREIEESVSLVEYLTYHELDFDEIKYFTPKYIKLAIEWKNNQD